MRNSVRLGVLVRDERSGLGRSFIRLVFSVFEQRVLGFDFAVVREHLDQAVSDVDFPNQSIVDEKAVRYFSVLVGVNRVALLLVVDPVAFVGGAVRIVESAEAVAESLFKVAFVSISQDFVDAAVFQPEQRAYSVRNVVFPLTAILTQLGLPFASC